MTVKRKVGRPAIVFTDDMIRNFEILMGLPCVTEEAIAEVLRVDCDTMVKWIKKTYGVNFSELRTIKRQGCVTKLAAKQYEQAMRGNTTMLIWLGKQWLGQSDKVDQKIDLTNLSDEELEKKITELEGSK